MNEKLDIDVKTLKPFTKFIYTIGVLPTSYLMSMTYEEQLVWLCNYLSQTIIPTINNNAEAVKEVQDLVLQLQEYINNYFDNLDVQEEINNKLDDMAESGQLTDIIAQYLGLAGVLAFNSVADMKNATNLVNGSTAKTLGFNTLNDLGGATYKIRTITNDDVIDEATIIELHDDTLIAELIMNNTMNAEQFGCVADNSTDITSKLQIALNKMQNKELALKNGTYIISSYLTLNNNTLLGKNATIKCNNSFSSNYMLSLSNKNKLTGITFDNNDVCISTTNSANTDLLLEVDNCNFIHAKKYVDSGNFALNGCLVLTAKEVILKNSNIYDNLAHGIKLMSTQAGSTALIDNCNIYNNGIYNNETITACGLANYERLYGDNYVNVNITNCHAYNNANSGFAIHSLNNCKIENCYAYGNLEHGITLMDGQNGIINHCICENNSAYGIRIQGDYNTEDYGYNNFIVSENELIGNSGIYLDTNINNGLIINNIFKASVTGSTRFGIVIGKEGYLTDTITGLCIKANKFIGTSYQENTKITSKFVLDETNDIDMKYYVNSVLFNGYITPKLKYSNVYDNLNTSYTDLSTWTVVGTRDGNVITPASGFICSKNFDISGAPKYINIMLDIVKYPPNFSVGLRFRNSSNTLINVTRKADSYTSNSISNSTKFNASLISKVFDLDLYTFAETPAKYEVFLSCDGSNTTPIIINAIYTSTSNDNTIINN